MGTEKDNCCMECQRHIQGSAMWTIYYGDGTTFRGLDGSPKDAPSTDVQIIHQGVDDLLFYHDYYLWRSDLSLWVPCNGSDGLLDHLMAFVDRIDAVVNGRYMEKEKWEPLLHRVRKDINKRGFSAHESAQIERRKVSL